MIAHFSYIPTVQLDSRRAFGETNYIHAGGRAIDSTLSAVDAYVGASFFWIWREWGSVSSMGYRL